MDEEIRRLNEISEFFRKTRRQIVLLKLLNKAKAEYDQYDYVAGKKTLIDAYLIDKTNPVTLRGLGCIKQFEGKFLISEIYFKKALKYSHKKEVEYCLLGMLYYLQEKLDAALEFFNFAIDANPDYESAYEGRNQTMLEQHLKIADLQEALKNYFK